MPLAPSPAKNSSASALTTCHWRRAGVLRLVDQDVVEPAVELVVDPARGVGAGEQRDGLDHEVLEVEGAARRLHPLVVGDGAGRRGGGWRRWRRSTRPRGGVPARAARRSRSASSISARPGQSFFTALVTRLFAHAQVAVGALGPEIEVGVDPVAVALRIDDAARAAPRRSWSFFLSLSRSRSRRTSRSAVERAPGDERGAEPLDVLAAVEAERALQVEEGVVERVVLDEPAADAVAAVDQLLHRPLDHEVAGRGEGGMQGFAERAVGHRAAASARVFLRASTASASASRWSSTSKWPATLASKGNWWSRRSQKAWMVWIFRPPGVSSARAKSLRASASVALSGRRCSISWMRGGELAVGEGRPFGEDVEDALRHLGRGGAG